MKASYFSTDVQEFIRTLAKHEVRYVIVGGEAVVYHGHARLTNGIDFFYEPTLENAEKLYAALDEYWLGEIPGLKSMEGLLIIDATVQFGDLPNMIVLCNSLTGVSFEEAWESKVEESVRIKGKKYPLYFIGLEELVGNKKALKRPIDNEDLKYLKALIKK
jgi:predicted nucleotidyltransferase